MGRSRYEVVVATGVKCQWKENSSQFFNGERTVRSRCETSGCLTRRQAESEYNWYSSVLSTRGTVE